ncbi:MAG: PHP domain-containing protein [Microcoleaceae cyanobacterium]
MAIHPLKFKFLRTEAHEISSSEDQTFKESTVQGRVQAPSSHHQALSNIPTQETLRQVFQAVNAETCPAHYNFHMHTVKSDGRLQPEQLIDQAIHLGLKGLAITDHHTLAGYQAAHHYLESWKTDNPEHQAVAPVLWSGIEISAGLLGTEVHILGYAFDPDSVALRPYLQRQTVGGDAYAAKQVIAAIHQAGGLAVLAHPARYRVPHTQLIPEAARLDIDGAEVYYNYHNKKPWLPTPGTTEAVKQLAEAHQLLPTCGTDTHGQNLLLRV